MPKGGAEADGMGLARPKAEKREGKMRRDVMLSRGAELVKTVC